VKRRANKEGSVFQRTSDGLWVGCLSLGYSETGKRKVKTFYGKTQYEALQKLHTAREDLRKGLPVDIKPQSVQQFLEHWLEHTLKPSAKPRSYESFRTIIRRHIVPVIGRVHLDKLTPQNVQSLLSSKLKDGLSPQTVNNIRTVLRSALQQALKWGLAHRNVAALVDPPRIPRFEIHPINAEQAMKFLETAKGSQFEAVFVLALNLGMRRGEILGLSWKDLEFDHKTIRISQALQRIGGKLQVCEVKTDRARRVIGMTDMVSDALRGQQEYQALQRAAGETWSESGLCFTNQTGGPQEPVTLNRHYKKALKAAGISGNVRFHDLRHACASLLLKQGVHLKVIQELLGHSSIKQTADTYLHVQSASMRETAKTMDAILNRKVPEDDAGSVARSEVLSR